jgi:hypothetical protein
MKAALAAFSCLLFGCAQTHTDVLDLGEGRHSLNATAPSGGFYGSHEAAVELANDFCGKSHQQPVIDGFYDKSEIGPKGEHSSSIFFRCAAPKTSRY